MGLEYKREDCLNADASLIDRIVESISWEEIVPFWQLYNSTRSVTPISTFKFGGGYDLSIKKQTPYFYGVRDFGGKLVSAVNCHLSDSDHLRFRLLTVHSEYKKSGFSYILLRKMELVALELGAMYTWSMPGERVFYRVFQKFGYEKIGRWVFENMYTPPNCYARKSVS